MSMIKKTLVGAALVASFALPSFAAKAEVVVVVGASSPVSDLTGDQVSQIFLGKSAVFPTGGQAVPIDQPASAAAREEFYASVTGKNASQLKAYWSKLIFTGKGQPPKEVGPGEIKELLASNPNLVSYLDAGEVDDSVKVVLNP